MRLKKNFAVTLLAVMALLNSGAAAASAPPIKIEDSRSVSERVTPNADGKSKKIKAAINVGNEFLRQVLDGRARDEMSQEWEATTGVLVAISDVELFAMLDGLSKSKEGNFNVCQPIRLASAEIVGDTVQLIYRSLIIGIVKWDERKEFFHHSRFERERQSEEHVITIIVNRNQRVASIDMRGMAIPLPYFPGHPSISAFINKKSFVGESPESIKARSATHVRAGRELEESAAKVCNIKTK